MKGRNQTTVTEFILSGFSSLPDLPVLFFALVLLIYLLILLGNALIIIVTLIDPILHTPMYFFLRNLSFLEISYTSVTIPGMLVNHLSREKTISVSSCAAQIYFLISFGGAECCLLALMAYDRYVAICIPLAYTVVMNRGICFQLVATAWLSSSLVTLLHVVWMFNHPFCPPLEIDHFFCDAPPVLQLVCGDTHLIEIEALASATVFVVIPFVIILWSYIRILTAILEMPSVEGQSKAFSTCSSHLTVVVLFFSTAGLTYFQPKSSSLVGSSKFLSLFYTILTPLLNPLVYSLRNKEVKRALQINFGQRVSSWRQF
ncbi:olfactory receptor 10A4-like [Alligator sinensis]|uniref:Olfactory receptor n=1 Tax=Alligator sinensis TaxID=38654 RepID=A0A1U7SQF7_ALLSI|nr:olfactory receptor 10A4-like [Alligator sinensis]